MVDSMNPTEARIMNSVASNTGDEVFTEDTGETVQVPLYKKIGDSIIPTSKHMGPLWRSRKDSAYAKLESNGNISNWDECIRYYKNDQRKGRVGTARRSRAGRVGEVANIETENLVFANTSALVPAIYAKNPTCEVTPEIRDDNQDDPSAQDDQLRALSTIAERLANTLASRKDAPGFNLKPKARKAVIMTTLTNISYIEVGYTRKEDSSEQALIDLQNAAAKLDNAKDQNEIIEAEGELLAIEEKISFLRPSGPWAKFKHPKELLRDPDSTEADLSDCKFAMSSEFISTAYINAVFREKVSDDPAEWKSIYKPTHVASAKSDGIDEEINNFSLLKDQTDMRSFGYTDDDAYKSALRTKVWKVWDKTTRRVYMFNDEDWSWPIWVWDDPYNLEGFFPFVPLMFYTDPEDDIGNSEVMYYLDQQDAINEMNAEQAKWRKWLRTNIFYNKTLIKDPTIIDKFLEGGDNRTALGLDLPPEAKITDAVFSVAPPSINFMQLFNKEQQYAAIARLSSVQPVMQGQQFKTNTTNQAIETYNSNQQTRLDEKVDAVEDCIGDVFWKVIQLCLQFMTPEEVGAILGQNAAAQWRNMSPAEIQTSFSVRIVGGSSQKPTSATKKAEALQIGQVLGQYANAGQGVVILQLLKLMERAFDEIVITEEDWRFLRETLTQSVANSNPTGNAQGAAPQGGGEGGIEQVLAMLMQIASSIPPEIQQVLGTAMARGVPLDQAITALVEELGRAQ